MCGIAGILDDHSGPVSPDDLRRLADALAHRGPDGEGLWISPDGRAGLVHRRLAILDTSDAGHQPMHSADGRESIVFNGEIYNFLELRGELASLGHRFTSESDTEVILAAWRQWGEGMLDRFNGMWALVLRDNRSGEAFLARDRFGIKPFLYAAHAGRLAFASEMRALRSLHALSSEMDNDVAERLLFDPFSVEGGSRTLFRDVARLPAGHCARWRNGRLSVRRWWRTVDHLVDVPASPAEQADRFRALLTDAVQLRMRSDVTIGTCLSGGFDSTAIVCTMSDIARASQPRLREAQDWRHAFVASFPGRSNDETPLALEAARWAHVEAHLLDLQRVDHDALEHVLADLDDVYIGAPEAPWKIYRALRKHGTLVSLDGHGADELMGGYLQQGQSAGFVLRNALAKATHASRATRAALDNAKMAWLSLRGLAHLRRHRLRAPASLELPADADDLPSHWGPLNRRLYRMFHATVLPTILRNFDRLSMAHGVEVRMPFMDWRLVTYVMSLPDEAKFGDGVSKLVARRAMSDRMPESIRSNTRKVGFNSPMPDWLNGELGPWAEQQLRQCPSQVEALIDTKRLIAKVHELSSSRSWTWESAGRLWPYINLAWYSRSSRLSA
ncbi:asparagine synthase (glutamine-hydrolyzing) [uncultured Methylibium sp.]|uniref:asparagine synthase (glutamine-hydrolyzing) n=1 Tax=uncultured Methylibium sp. TaxID=381093 RepID=UPI0025DE8490|nr:asparagine synthase (glutamine-hydrolyzing) [uncultured Methylibium sp.]